MTHFSPVLGEMRHYRSPCICIECCCTGWSDVLFVIRLAISDPMAPSQTGSIAARVYSLGRRTTVYKRGASLIVLVVSVRGMRMGSRNRDVEMDSDTIDHDMIPWSCKL